MHHSEEVASILSQNVLMMFLYESVDNKYQHQEFASWPIFYIRAPHFTLPLDFLGLQDTFLQIHWDP